MSIIYSHYLQRPLDTESEDELELIQEQIEANKTGEYAFISDVSGKVFVF